MECPTCGTMMLEKVRDIPFNYNKQTITVENVAGKECPNCSEFVWTSKEGKKADAAYNKLVQEINLRSPAPKFICKVRKKLKLNQQEAENLFGVGDKCFSRYETGKTKPPESLVKLFQVLNNHPELLNEIQPSAFA
jgi:HTH-type transcriptional regulator/antitoxin MqsA